MISPPISKDTTGGYETMNCVSNSSDQDAELVPTVDVLLLEAEDDWAEVVVVGEVVPVLGPVEILLVGGLHHARQLEAAVLAPVLLYDGFLPGSVRFLNDWKTFRSLALLGGGVRAVNRVE